MPAAPDYDVCIAGLGAMGLSCAWHFARRGMRVLGLDAHSIPNTRGSSHGGSRAFRMAYFEHSGYVPLLRRSLELWRELEQASGTELLLLSGGVYIGQPDSALLSGCLAACLEHSLEHSLLERGELRQRWPQLAVPKGLVGLHEPLAGICRVEATLNALADQARSSGAELREHSPLLDWQARDSQVTLLTAQAEISAKQLVLCPGAYAAELLKPGTLAAKLRITPTRQVVGWFAPERQQRTGPGSFPVWALELPDGQFWYGFAALPGSPGLKLGRHQPGPAVDPLTEERQTRPAEALELLDFAARWLPDDAGALRASSVCLYENSPDGHFVLGWHPACAGRPAAEQRVLVACGGSGHAFKFTPVIGELLTGLALDGASPLDIGFLDPLRFA